MQEQGGGLPTWSAAVHWVRWLWGFQVLQAKVSPHLCFAWGTLPGLKSNLRWLLLVLGLDIPRRSRAVNLGWLLLPVLGLGLIEASRSLFERV